MAAARATLLEALTPEAYAHLDGSGERLHEQVIDGPGRRTTCRGTS